MIGKNILHYKILEKLGEGGMGIVYKAEDTKLDRFVALKFLPQHLSQSKEEKQRFIHEAKAASALDHNNVCTIYEIDETEDGQMFIAMAAYAGESLREKIKRGSMAMEEAIDITTQITRGLAKAHSKQIVHRDIKPENILVTEDGVVKIVDFGLAKLSGTTMLTKAGTTLGTVSYMSPEQTQGTEVDHRTDVWALGVVFYEMISGQLPFRGDYDQALIYSILNEEPQFVEIFENQHLIQKVIKKALQKDREKRYSQISEMIADLETTDGSNASRKENEIKEIKRLAVLPFSNIVDDPQTNFLGFALADQIIGSMAYSKNILVRPSSTIRKYQDQIVEIHTAGSELNVNYILAGNYLKESDIIRLNIELIDLESEEMIWRESIQIKYNNVFEVQDIVAQKVVDGLKVRFSDEERARMKPDTPKNPEAYELYLRAVSNPYTVEGNNVAIEMLNNSIALDSTFALAYLELGIRNNQLSQVGKSTAQASDNAEKSLLQALSLNSNLLPALANLALIYTDAGKHEEAHLLLIRALKINPNHAWLHFSLGYHYRYIGFLEESEKEMEIALSIDPQNPRFRSSIIAYMYLEKYDEVLESFNLDSGSPFTLNYLGEVYFRKGNKELALECFKKSLSIKEEVGEFYFASSFVEYMEGNIEKAAKFNIKREKENPADSKIWYEIARVYGLLEMKEACCRSLKKSIDMGYISYPSMQRDSFLDSVKDDPVIQDLLSQAKIKHAELKKKLVTFY